MTCQTSSTMALPASPCERIPLIESALFELAAGKAKSTVRYGQNWVEFHPASITWLQSELTRCRALCPDVARGGQPRGAISVVPAGPAAFTRRFER